MFWILTVSWEMTCFLQTSEIWGKKWTEILADIWEITEILNDYWDLEIPAPPTWTLHFFDLFLFFL